MLVFIDTFSGWTEVSLTKYKTANMVSKKLIGETLPRYGFPVMTGSDNGPAFISSVSQGIATSLGTNWKLHCAYIPQSSGQVEKMNRALKKTLPKLALKIGVDWVILLLFALLRVKNPPYQMGLTPFEIMCETTLPWCQASRLTWSPLWMTGIC